MRFRQDINGLRAIAVLPVIFFHAGLAGFSGGYLGVDVFFVISGFLITANIISSQRNGSFTLISFYDKRVRRIVPPLVFVTAITAAFSFAFMLPYDLKNFGQSLVATSFGANNVLLYLTSGYWSLASEFKPLYHTWSLGIEEQYYFIVPITFIIFSRKTRALASVICMFFLASFLSSYLINDIEFNFLIIITRFWELCAGSLLAMLLSRIEVKGNDIYSLAGLVAILFSYYNPVFISDNPAIINAAPVAGAVLVIAFTKSNGYIYSALSSKLALIVGLSSYSIYLIHQPILSFLRLATEGEVGVSTQLAFALLSIPMGYLSWKFLESPFRSKKTISNKVFYPLIATCLFMSVFLGAFLHKTYGMHEYGFFEKFSYGVNPQAYADRAYALSKSDFSTESKKMLIIGNSFARDFYNALDESGATNGYEVVYLYNYFLDKISSRSLVKSADVVIYVSSSGMANKTPALDDLKRSAFEVKDELDMYSNGNYYFVGTKNFGYNNNFIRWVDWDASLDYMVDINKSNIVANNIESKIFGDKYIDILSLFRVGDKVRMFTDEHRFMSFDTDHITMDGARYLGEAVIFNTNIKNILL